MVMCLLDDFAAVGEQIRLHSQAKYCLEKKSLSLSFNQLFLLLERWL